MRDVADEVEVQEVSFPAGNKVLKGRLYLPAAAPVAAMVLNSATGVPQGYYKHFARWLARERGMACLTYDYSDFGDSATAHPRHSDATMAHWALVDQPAAREEMRRLLPGVPLQVLGHSLGAMLMPLQEGLEDVTRMIGVASGLVRHDDHPWPYQALARAFWFGHVPVLVRLMGYLPGRLIGFGENLPAGVYWQWRRWCTVRGSYLPETGKVLPTPDWSRSGAPVSLFAFSDDETIPPQCVERLGQVYGDDYLSFREIAPDEVGLQKIGHLGAFSRHASALWPELVPEG